VREEGIHHNIAKKQKQDNIKIEYYIKPVWDQVRGLTLARNLISLPMPDPNSPSEDELFYKYFRFDFYHVAQLMYTSFYTIPPQILFIIDKNNKNSTDLVKDYDYKGLKYEMIKVPMPLGEIPKPSFETILIYVIRGLSRLRWNNRNWRGMGYGLHKMASTNTGLIIFDGIVEALKLYLTLFWSSLFCNSLLFEYQMEVSGAMAQRPVIDRTGPDCEYQFFQAIQSINEWYKSILLGKAERRRNSVDMERIWGLALDVLALRDLFYISSMIGKVNLITRIDKLKMGVLVVAKQSWLEKLSKTRRNEEPPSMLFNLLFGDPTGLAIIPIISAISRVYGGGLWPRVPRMFSPIEITESGQRLSYIEVLDRSREPPPGLDPSMRVQGIVEASLFMESLDVYASSVFFMPWERASAVTLLLRMLGRGLSYLWGSCQREKSECPDRLLDNYIYNDNNVVALPMSITWKMAGLKQYEPAQALVYRQRMLHLAAQDLDTIAVELMEAGHVDRAIEIVTKTLRSHVAALTQNVDERILRNYERYLWDEKEMSNYEKDIGIRFRGIAVEVLNPIIDLIPDPEGLARVIASKPTQTRRLLKNIIDRLADSEYTRVFIYYIVDLDDINKLYKKYSLIIGECDEQNVNNSLCRQTKAIHDLRRITEAILEIHEPLRRFTENLHLDLAHMEFQTY